MTLLTPGVDDDGERISASAYGRLQDPPIGPSAMTRLFQRDMPSYFGTDAHGRHCRMVNPAEADLWRSRFCTPKVGPDGHVRGMPPAGGSSGKAKPPNPPFKAVAAEDRYDAPVKPKVPRNVAPDPEDPGGSATKAERLAEARAAGAEDDAAARRFRRLQLEEKLMDRDAGLDVIADFTGEIAKMIDRMPAGEATALAAAIGCDEHTAYRALVVLAEKQRGDLARYARTARAGLDAIRSSRRGGSLVDDRGGDPAEAEAHPAGVGGAEAGLHQGGQGEPVAL